MHAAAAFRSPSCTRLPIAIKLSHTTANVAHMQRCASRPTAHTCSAVPQFPNRFSAHLLSTSEHTHRLLLATSSLASSSLATSSNLALGGLPHAAADNAGA
jgi:hypothetical protein